MLPFHCKKATNDYLVSLSSQIEKICERLVKIVGGLGKSFSKNHLTNH
jgi:hypothetical protein